MKLAIIIPTKNEEMYLPHLADSIMNQTFTNYKVFIADANSTDKTIKIAKKYGFTPVEGGKPTFGRNNGASEAIKWGADILLFVDSDVVFTERGFLEKALHEIRNRKLDVAGTLQEPYNLKNFQSIMRSRKFMYKAITDITNASMLLLEKSKKPLMQVCMFVTTDAFKIIGGFRPLIFGEDSQFSIDAKKSGYKFGILKKSGKVLLSMRRYERKGFIRSKNMFFVKEMLLGHMYYETDTYPLSFRYFD